MLKELFSKCLLGPWITGNDDTQYKIENSILYFQCSNSKSDWISNFDFPIGPYKDGTIKWYGHRGFINTWKSIRDKILNEIVGSNVTTIVGYSRGAAIALLAHEDCIFNNIKVKTYAFGCPRVVWMPDKELSTRWNDFTRIKVRGDIITNVPPWLFGYKHVGKEIKLGKCKFPWPTHHEPKEYILYIEKM